MSVTPIKYQLTSPLVENNGPGLSSKDQPRTTPAHGINAPLENAFPPKGTLNFNLSGVITTVKDEDKDEEFLIVPIQRFKENK